MKINKIAHGFWVIAVILGAAYGVGAMARSGAAFQGLAGIDHNIIIIWKSLSAGFLALSVTWVARTKPVKTLAISLSVIVFADFLLAVGYVTLSGVVFIIAHLIAIGAYILSRKAWRDIGPVVKVISILVPLIVVLMAALIIMRTDLSPALALFPVFSASAASFALRSRFPVLLTGLGAVIFMMSDSVFVLASLNENGTVGVGWIVWICYFTGLALITRGALKYSAAS